jgi:hypothetical protein
VGRIDALTVAARVFENPIHCSLLLDAADHARPPTAAPADLDLHRKDALEALCPGE